MYACYMDHMHVASSQTGVQLIVMDGWWPMSSLNNEISIFLLSWTSVGVNNRISILLLVLFSASCIRYLA